MTRVRCFREKPDKEIAEQFLAAGNFYWNSGMFLWSAKTLVNALRQYLPATAALLEKIAATWGTRKFDETLRKLYPKCEDKSVDYGILEPRSAAGEAGLEHLLHSRRLGMERSWLLGRALRASHRAGAAQGQRHLRRRQLYARCPRKLPPRPGKFIAAIGVEGLVVVDSGDALLITTIARSQDVGKIVKYLDQQKQSKLT